MMPWLRAGAILLAHAALGALALRAVGARAARALGPWGAGAAGALLALEAVFLAVLGAAPLVTFLAVLALLALVGRLDRREHLAAARRRRRVTPRNATLLAGVAVVAAFIALRPAVPLYWDEFVWLGKARLVASDLDGLRAATLDARAVVPPGYPLFWPLSVGWLTGHRTDAAALVVAARLLVGVTAVIYLGAVATRARRREWAWGMAVLSVVAAPFLFVHLRSIYVDLPVALLAGALAALLVVPARRQSPLLVAVVAGALASAKDEGLVHVAAIGLVALAAALRGRDPSRLTAPFAAFAGAAVPFIAWRVLLLEHGAADADHGLGWPSLAMALPLARVWAAHALDLRSWGLFWPIAAGVALAESTRRDARGAAARRLAWMLGCDVIAVFVGLTACPERVHEFAQNGTLVGRLLLQHAPLAALLVLEVAEVRLARVRRRSRRAPAGTVRAAPLSG